MATQILSDDATELFKELTTRQVDEGLVYRGHGKSQYRLVPSFQRPNRKDQFLSADDTAQLTASSWPYRVFYRMANQMGLPLPSVAKEKHQNYTSEDPMNALMDFADEAEGEYDFDDLEIMAFAQHYQIPTQLLDWSRSPLAAMYFAASSALHQISDFLQENKANEETGLARDKNQVVQRPRDFIETNRLSIWQANSLALNMLSEQRHLMEMDAQGTYTVRFFTPRTQGNLNIVAQQGLFSIHHPKKMTMDFRYAEASPKCLTAVVAEHESWLDSRSGGYQFLHSAKDKGLLKEYLLPYSQVVALLKLLDKCGIHAASIYPGHQGCAQLVKERAAISLVDNFL